jgi:hypothetical protein
MDAETCLGREPAEGSPSSDRPTPTTSMKKDKKIRPEKVFLTFLDGSGE